MIIRVWSSSSNFLEISPGCHLHKLGQFLANFTNFPGTLTWLAIFVAFSNFMPPRVFCGQGPVFLQQSFSWNDFLCDIPVISWVFLWRQNVSSPTNLGAQNLLSCRSGPDRSIEMCWACSVAGAHEIGALTAKPSLAGADAILRKGGEGCVLLVSLVLHFFCMLFTSTQHTEKMQNENEATFAKGNFRMAFNWPKHAAAAKEYSFSGIASNPLCRSWLLFCVAISHQYCTGISLLFLLVRISLHAVQSLPCF